MKFLLLVLPAIIFNGYNAVILGQNTSDALICAYGNYYGISYNKFNTQNLIAESFNKFIVSNKTTHIRAITIYKRTRLNVFCKNEPEVLIAVQTAVPIESCNTQTINCYKSSCATNETPACCDGNYCNKAENIIINHAVFYPNTTLAITENDSSKRYSNVTCSTAYSGSNKPCIIVN